MISVRVVIGTLSSSCKVLVQLIELVASFQIAVQILNGSIFPVDQFVHVDSTLTSDSQPDLGLNFQLLLWQVSRVNLKTTGFLTLLLTKTVSH